MVIKGLDKILYDFIWRKRTGKKKFKKEVICNTKELGGLEDLDYSTLNDTFKM